MAGWQFVVACELDGFGANHGRLRINHEIEQSVDAIELIKAYGADGLFAHGTLVGVSRGLVVVRIGNQTGDCAEDGEGFDLKMRAERGDITLVHRDEGIVLLVDVEVLYETLREEVVEGHLLLAKGSHVL